MLGSSSYFSSSFQDSREEDSSAWELPRGTRRPLINASIRSSASASLSSVSTESEREDLVTYHISKLEISLDNSLIYFFNLHHGDGVFIAPTKQDSGGVYHLQRLLFENFRNSVELIHGLLELSKIQRTNLSASGEERSKWTSKSLVAVKEHVSLISLLNIMCAFDHYICIAL